MELNEIKRLVREGRYSVRPDAIKHAIKEGFTEKDIVYAVLNGREIERRPEDYRCLIYSCVPITEGTLIDLHVVCEYWRRDRIDFVTAYVPDPTEWETPPFRRKKR